MKNENPVIIPEKPANIGSAQLQLEQAQHRLVMNYKIVLEYNHLKITK